MPVFKIKSRLIRFLNLEFIYFKVIPLSPGFIELSFLEVIRFYCQNSALRSVFKPQVFSLLNLLEPKCPK